MNAEGKWTCELALYGPGGAPICYQCAMATPESRAEADRRIAARFDEIEARGDVVTLTADGIFGLTGKGEAGRA